MSVRDEEAIAALARVLAHETCVRLIDALGAGESTVSDLACRLSLDQPRVSTHLALLREVGMVDVQATGRQRVYALRGQRTLAAGLHAAPAPSDPGPADTSPIRLARTCYDHLAGVAGVGLMDALLARGWLESASGRDLRLTAGGTAALTSAGVDLEGARRSRRAFAIDCADWTERRPHLGGALGAALLATLLDQGRVHLRPGERAVDLAPGEPAAFLELVKVD
jgi:DNA-binding transcriptional ArsR family regulator